MGQSVCESDSQSGVELVGQSVYKSDSQLVGQSGVELVDQSVCERTVSRSVSQVLS